MINAYSIGFVCVAAVAVGGVDYVMQAQAAGKAPGQYSVTEYIGSYTDRFDETIAAHQKASRQSEPARTHLPEFADGWERREWTPDTEGHDELLKTMNILQQASFKKGIRAARTAAKYQAWEYVRGSETVRLTANFKLSDPDDAERPRVTAFIDPGLQINIAQAKGYGVVKGVPFMKLVNIETEAGSQPGGPVFLQAFLGDDMAIGVYAETDDKSLRALLEQINYDALNAMLETPLQGIGSEAPVLAQEQEAEMIANAVAGFDALYYDTLEARNARTRAGLAGKSSKRKVGSSGASTFKKVEGVAPVESASQQGLKPQRLKLSGGNSCLSGSAGRLCGTN